MRQFAVFGGVVAVVVADGQGGVFEVSGGMPSEAEDAAVGGFVGHGPDFYFFAKMKPSGCDLFKFDGFGAGEDEVEKPVVGKEF